jgi:hypothetical protein
MGIDADRNDEGRDDDYDEYRDYHQHGEHDDGGASGGDGHGPDDQRAYWRRRFLVLCGGVAALGVCAWLFPGAQQESARTAASVRASMAALATRQALPVAAYGAAGPVATQSLSPLRTVSAEPAGTVNKPSTAYHPGTAADPGTGAAVAGAAPRSSGCAPGAIVLSLFTSQSSYPKGARPKFSVYAVSTSATACTLPYGAGSVEVVATRHGQVVWDSAACGAPAAKQVRFTLGVPQVLTMTWNPRAVAPAGCAGSLAAGAWGTFDAVAMSHDQTSPVRTFKLGG